MITDYEPYLCVTKDGRIWWLRKHAIQLGAGFLPVRDDQALNTELRAPNQRALVNERTLIGAFGSDRYSIERPMTFERDDFCYVEAEGFLTWLSQYIEQTQANIAFPNELAREVRMAMAKAAASRSQVAGQDFDSLALALDGCFDKKLDDLPESLRQRVEQDFYPNLWDALSADQRCRAILQLDYQNDPATEQSRQHLSNFFERLDELHKKKEQWKSAATPTASDMELKETRLKELEQEIGRIELQKRQARGDYYPERKPLDADKKAIPATEFMAYPKAQDAAREKGGRPKEPLSEAVEMAYIHFQDKGDVEILKPGNIKSFLKSFKSLANDEDLSHGFENGNIRAYIAERIKEVKIPREGECSVVTQERREARKLNPSQRYSQKAIAKLLSNLRKKYPLPS
jgi:hypothetical protein